ncbi:MAG: rod shape-determining protein MreC [Deltaproteobacteria bacterium]|jgi:rod shape-determining protein MreC|nr:MAG: rod shape-determining protein MreC [Deltaproteobacteria bacterium]
MLSVFRRYRVIVITVSLCIVAILLISLNIKERKKPHLFEEIIFEVSSPFQKTIQSTVKGVKTLWGNYVFLVNLKKENTVLNKTINALKEENLRLREAAIANIRLRKLLLFKEEFTSPMVPAEVIGEDPSSWFKTIILDKGSKDGIEKKMAVVTSEGMIGCVIEVSISVSKVLLSTDHSSAIDVMVQRTRAKGILEGRVNQTCQLKYVSRADDVRMGDDIISSGLGGIFPKGLLLGRVSKIKREGSGLFQYVEVTPSVDFAKLEEVFIVVGDKSASEK